MSRRRKLRVLVMMHEELMPPASLEGLSEKEVEPFKTEYDVVTALDHLDHEVHQIGLHDELRPLRLALKESRPHVVFNLLEEFHVVTFNNTYWTGWPSAEDAYVAPYTPWEAFNLVIHNLEPTGAE